MELIDKYMDITWSILLCSKEHAYWWAEEMGDTARAWDRWDYCDILDGNGELKSDKMRDWPATKDTSKSLQHRTHQPRTESRKVAIGLSLLLHGQCVLPAMLSTIYGITLLRQLPMLLNEIWQHTRTRSLHMRHGAATSPNYPISTKSAAQPLPLSWANPTTRSFIIMTRWSVYWLVTQMTQKHISATTRNSARSSLHITSNLSRASRPFPTSTLHFLPTVHFPWLHLSQSGHSPSNLPTRPHSGLDLYTSTIAPVHTSALYLTHAQFQWQYTHQNSLRQ